jgi:hypothetical protein
VRDESEFEWRSGCECIRDMGRHAMSYIIHEVGDGVLRLARGMLPQSMTTMVTDMDGSKSVYGHHTHGAKFREGKSRTVQRQQQI